MKLILHSVCISADYTNNNSDTITFPELFRDLVQINFDNRLEQPPIRVHSYDLVEIFEKSIFPFASPL